MIIRLATNYLASISGRGVGGATIMCDSKYVSMFIPLAAFGVINRKEALQRCILPIPVVDEVTCVVVELLSLVGLSCCFQFL